MGVRFREGGERNKDSLEGTHGRSFAFGWKCRCGAEKISIYSLRHKNCEATKFINHVFDASGARRLLEEFSNSKNDRGILNRAKVKKCFHKNDWRLFLRREVAYPPCKTEILNLTPEEVIFWFQLEHLYSQYAEESVFQMEATKLIKARYYLPEEGNNEESGEENAFETLD